MGCYAEVQPLEGEALETAIDALTDFCIEGMKPAKRKNDKHKNKCVVMSGGYNNFALGPLLFGFIRVRSRPTNSTALAGCLGNAQRSPGGDADQRTHLLTDRGCAAARGWGHKS